MKNAPSISLYPREVPLPIKGFDVKVNDYSNGFINLGKFRTKWSVVFENHLKKGYDKALQYLVDFRYLNGKSDNICIIISMRSRHFCM